MSQADETLETLEKPKRVSRKRVPKVIDEDSMATPVPQKRPSRNKTSAEPGEDNPKVRSQSKTQKADSPERKAPTPIAATKAATKSSRRQAAVVGVLILLGVGASAIVGFTDKGPINVEKTIADRNDRISRGEIQGEVVPVQNTPQVANGGMVGLGSSGQGTTTVQTPPGTASSSASTTLKEIAKETTAQAAASSTEESQ